MIDYTKIPNQAMAGAIKRYIENRIQPGGFLTALFENNLTQSFGRADHTNTQLMRQWVDFIYNEMPMDLVGSKENVANHLAGRTP